MNTFSLPLRVLPIAALLLAGAAWSQQSGTTPGGASTNTGAGVGTSGPAAPAGQTPRAPDSSVGKQGGGTGAGMGTAPAGHTEAKGASTKKQAKSSKAKKGSTHAKSTKASSKKA